MWWRRSTERVRTVSLSSFTSVLGMVCLLWMLFWGVFCVLLVCLFACGFWVFGFA